MLRVTREYADLIHCSRRDPLLALSLYQWRPHPELLHRSPLQRRQMGQSQWGDCAFLPLLISVYFLGSKCIFGPRVAERNGLLYGP